MQDKYIWQLPNWSNFEWQDSELIKTLGEARAVQSKLLTEIKNLGFKEQSRAFQELLLEETLQTAKIEGENYQRNSVRSSIAKHLGLAGGREQKIEPHVDGLVQVLLNATQKYSDPLTKNRIKSWHAALFPTGYSGLYKIEVGKWRTEPVVVVSGAIGGEVVHYEGLPAELIDKEMGLFLSWWKNSLELDGLLRAAIAHFWFVMIHPFADGNGRMARILTDMALAEDEKLANRYYSLSSQIMDERSKYYDVLKQCQVADRDITPWIEWFLDTFIKATDKSRLIIGTVLEKANFWHKHQETIINERQRKAVNKLLDVGRGNFKGGLTTRKYASLTKTSKATAFREIDDLLKKNMLKPNKGQGRNVSYDLKF